MFYYCFGYSIGYFEFFDYIFSNKECNKIKKCCLYYCLEWSKNFGWYNGGYWIGCIMKFVNIVKN